MANTQYSPEQLASFSQLELQHRQLASRNPIVAAGFYAQHASAIAAARSAGGAQLMPDILTPRSTQIEDVLGMPKAFK